MLDHERVFAAPLGREVLVGRRVLGRCARDEVVRLDESSEQLLVRWLRHHYTLIENLQKRRDLDAKAPLLRRALDQVQALLIVPKPHKPDVDPLLRVQALLRLEHVLVEELLQLLVGVVDEELLERVVPEDLEAEHVQDPDVQQHVKAPALPPLRELLVDRPHQPVKDAAVYGLRERVAGACALHSAQGDLGFLLQFSLQRAVLQRKA
mmetsp:Transcript_982/g.1275  ORF Transcript_982/g.1275 Transcript_982/m.1275 type:complete len:208 (+) Transcript_982:164-787(+)